MVRNFKNSSSQILSEVCDVLKDSSGLLEIEKWKCFEIDFSKPIEKKEEIYSLIKGNTGKITGLYAIFDGPVCLYIGKGKIISQRIKAHYNASKDFKQPPRWVAFFKQYSKKLNIHWVEYNNLKNDSLDDQLRQLFEVVLQLKYEPEFEKFSVDYKRQASKAKRT